MKTGYRHRYSLGEFLLIYSQSLRAFPVMIANKIKHRIGPHFQERLMLAVTEVNGCEVCSYAHTQLALKQGMNLDEILSFLQGSGDMIKKEEAKAILFAQHYADFNGRPDQMAYETLIGEYGKKTAKAIIAAIQIMMFGNANGLPISALLSRLKKHPYHNSSLVYELTMSIAPLYLLPFALVMTVVMLPFTPANIIFAKKKSGE